MHLFSYIEGASPEAAVQAVSDNPQAAFFAGGTTLIDLMKLDVMTPDALVDINRLPFSSIEANAAGITIEPMFGTAISPPIALFANASRYCRKRC
jgi:xanthine dehydrogenase YagS FAD-binding subunit